jgi:hypothetical protein
MRRIGLYLNTTVTLVRTTLASGDRTETETSGVSAAKFEDRVYVRSETGGHYEDVTFLGFKHDTDLEGVDKIIVDGVRRAIKSITPVRESRFSSRISHIEVQLA